MKAFVAIIVPLIVTYKAPFIVQDPKEVNKLCLLFIHLIITASHKRGMSMSEVHCYLDIHCLYQ